MCARACMFGMITSVRRVGANGLAEALGSSFCCGQCTFLQCICVWMRRFFQHILRDLFPLVCGVCDCALHNMHSCFVLLRNSVCCAQSSMRSALVTETCCAFCLRSAHVRTLPPGNKSARRNDASTSEMRACTAGTKNVVRVRMCWWWWANVRMRGDVMTVGN